MKIIGFHIFPLAGFSFYRRLPQSTQISIIFKTTNIVCTIDLQRLPLTSRIKSSVAQIPQSRAVNSGIA
jgi:hypothetical protein